MLYLELLGYGYSKSLCKDVVSWFVSKYLPRHKLDITILHRSLKRDGAYGYCDVIERPHNPREFIIELDTHLDKETYITVLLHELYHALQFCKGELKIKSSKRYYKGECVEDLEYYEQPHEIEAIEQEKILYLEYLINKQSVPDAKVALCFPNRLLNAI